MAKGNHTKRIAALVLTLVLVAALLPLGFTAKAETPDVLPFYTINWSYVDNSKFDYIYSLPFTWISSASITRETTQINSIFTNSRDIETSARNLKEQFDARPEGTRHLNLAAMRTVMCTTAIDRVDLTHGVALAKDYMERFMAEYSRIGGKLDGVVLDLEYFSANHWYLHTGYNNGQGDAELYNKVVSNNVYQTRIRPKLVARGFDFYTGSDHAEIWYVNPNSGTLYSKNSAIWDAAINELLAEHQNEAIYEPVKKYYPNAVVSDYVTGDTSAAQKGMAGDGGRVGNGQKVGNTSNSNAYNAAPSLYFYGYTNDPFYNDEGQVVGPTNYDKSSRNTYTKPASYYNAVYPDSAYGRALWDVNKHKRILEHTDTGYINSWIAFCNYNNATGGYANTAYYSETIFHIGLMSSSSFLGYIVDDEVPPHNNYSPNPDPNLGSYEYNLQIVEDLMIELTRVAGASDRKPIVLPTTWNENYILSGMYAGGRNIWRLTPDTSKVSLEDFRVEGTAPTFSVGGLTITFPQGRIIEDGNITQVGTCGYWIETPENVTPVVTSNPNRYSENPAFQDTFDTYATGTFTTESVLPETYWTVSGTASITENKTVALSGSTTLTNTKVPAKITAGDEFANEQVWEVTVTLPSSNYGTVTLLSTGSTDGVQIKNNKVYYYKQGTYISSYWSTTQLCSISAGNTYTIRRVMNFNNSTCSYYVFDANGGTVESATGKSFKSVTLPVSNISFTTSSTTNAVQLDNYKLYPTGLTAEFEVYDEYGIETTVGTARTADTTYRLSWLNASSAHKVAEIYDSISGDVIKRVPMTAGMDGVVVDTIEAGSSSINLNYRIVDGSAPVVPDSDDFSWDSFTDYMGITCIVGDQGYAKLEDAIDAATESGKKIILLDDTVIESTATVDAPIRLQTNGYTITTADNFSGDYAIGVAAGGALNWTGDIDAGSKTALRVCGGELTVAGGTIAGKNGVEVTGGSLNVTGGAITATEKAIWLNQDADKLPATVNVTGGNLSGAKAFYHSNATETPSANISATISGASVTGAVETAEQHYAIKTEGGVYTLHGHIVVIDEAVAPTCTETGLTEGLHYPCCNEVGIAQQIVPALNHAWIEATCTTPKSCPTCGATEGFALGHAWVEADCDTPKTCSICQATEGEALGHLYNSIITLPTCTSSGYTTHTCSACGGSYSDNITDATGHIPGAAQIENEVPATCYNEGSYDKVSRCIVCGEVTSRETVTTPITHTYTVSGTTSTCTICGHSVEQAAVSFALSAYGDLWRDAANMTLNPGETKYYTVVPATSYYNMADFAEKNTTVLAAADANTWKVKFEYPLGGVPTIYLKGATIKNPNGIDYYGPGTLKVVVLEDSSITTSLKGDSNHTTWWNYDIKGAIVARANDVIIEGPGKLTLETQRLGSIGSGVIDGKNITLQNGADVVINQPAQPSSSLNSIYATGNILLDNADLTVYAWNFTNSHDNRPIWSVFCTANNLTIQNGSKVFGAGSPANSGDRQNLIEVGGVITVSNSDVELGAGGTSYYPVFDATPNLILNDVTAVTGTGAAFNADTKVITPSEVADYNDDPATLVWKKYVKITHTCVGGEPTFTTLSETACAMQKLKVTCCAYCGEEMSRETITVPNGAGHTYEQTLTIGQEATSAADGYYVKQTVCTSCGDTLSSEQIPFSAARFFYLTSGANPNWIDFGSYNRFETVLNPGQVVYFTTGKTDPNYPDNYYMNRTQDSENWNVKIVYPMGGTPTMILKNATIKNDVGIFYGYTNNANTAPLQIVVAADSEIYTTSDYMSSLTLYTQGDVTITGPGKLTITDCSKNAVTYGAIMTAGNLILDHADIELYLPDDPGRSCAFSTAGGDMTVNGGNLFINAWNNTANHGYTIISAFYLTKNAEGKGGNLIIENDANVVIAGSPANLSDPVIAGMIKVDGDIIIRQSDVEIGCGGTTYYPVFSGFTGNLVLEGCTAAYSTAKPTFDAATGTLSVTDLDDYNNTVGFSGIYYFKVSNDVTEIKSSITVGNSLTFTFRTSAEEVNALNGSYAKVTRTYADGRRPTVTQQALITDTSGNYYDFAYHGLAAKEMGDSFTIAIYDDNGRVISEIKQDSMQNYALRLLRSEEYADDIKLKTLLVDMLNYGAEAQKQFGYNEDNLVNAYLTAEEQALATAAAPEAPASSAAIVDGNGYYGTSFVLNNDITMLVAVRNRYVDEGSYALVTFTDHYGNSIDQENRRLEISDYYSTKNITAFAFNGMVAADGKLDVTFEIFKSDGTRIVTITDSLERYCARSTDLPLAPYIMKYSEAAHAYLHQNDNN